MAFKNAILQEEDKPNLTPMIDVVFLLLIYFMVVTTIIKQEADVGIQLPAKVPPETDVDLPVDHFIEILEDGQVLINQQPVDTPVDIDMQQLKGMLVRLKESSDIAGLKTLITIHPHDAAKHERTIAVLNACAFAKIKMVTFGAPEDL